MSRASTSAQERICPEPADVIRLGQVALAFGRVNRITRHEDGTTPESDTDHTVMLGLIACALAERWYPHLNRGLVAEYALVHDLVEVHAGDTPTLSIDAAGAAAKEQREQEAAQRLEDEFIGSLPWVPLMITAYEARTTPEARFVRAVDKLLPKITHLLNDRATLIEQGITRAELEASWNRQADALTGYASDFPELLSLCTDLVAAVAAGYDGPNPKDGTGDPSERACRMCGCTENNACWPPCWWIGADLCSACPAGTGLVGSTR